MSRSNSQEPVVYLFLLGSFLYTWGLRIVKKNRQIRNLPTSRVQSAAMGPVELSGIARPQAAQNAPFSGMKCCWWECDVQELRSNGKNRHWATICQKRAIDLLYLEDRTGRMLINPYGAEFDVHTSTFELNSATRTMMAPALATWGINDMRWFGGLAKLRVVERVIPDSAPLYVIGELLSSKNSFAEGSQDRFADRLRRIKADQAKMREADANGDGTIDAQEWDAFRVRQEELFMKEAAARRTETPEVVMVAAPKEGPFLIATKSEDELTAKYSWLGPLALLGGLALNCLAAYLAVAARWNPYLIAGVFVLGLGYGFIVKKSPFSRQ